MVSKLFEFFSNHFTDFSFDINEKLDHSNDKFAQWAVFFEFNIRTSCWIRLKIFIIIISMGENLMANISMFTYRPKYFNILNNFFQFALTFIYELITLLIALPFRPFWLTNKKSIQNLTKYLRLFCTTVENFEPLIDLKLH